MCSELTLDSQFDKSNIKLIGNVYCPETMCLNILCMHKMTFQSLDRSGRRFPECESMCQVCISPFEEQTNSFFLKFAQRIYIFEEKEKPFQDVFGAVCCSTCPNEIYVHFSTNKACGFYDCKKCKSCSHVLNIYPRGTKNGQNCCLVEMVHIALQEKRFANMTKEIHLHFWRNFLANHSKPHRNMSQKRQKSFLFWNGPVGFPMVDTVNHNLITSLILYAFDLQ